jgi:hypothetical protein
VSDFETGKVRLFIERAQSAGLVSRIREDRGKFLIALNEGEHPIGVIEFYRPDDARFGRVRSESRDQVRDLWASASTEFSVSSNAAEEFEYYLQIYSPHRNENVEFSAIADFVIRLYRAAAKQPPSREDLVADLSAVEDAYDRLTGEMKQDDRGNE